MRKVIGIFGEIDGEEFKDDENFKKKLGLIGSTSGDVGSVELYYTADGKTYAIANNSQDYYGTTHPDNKIPDDVQLGDIIIITKSGYDNKKAIVSKKNEFSILGEFDGKRTVLNIFDFKKIEHVVDKKLSARKIKGKMKKCINNSTYENCMTLGRMYDVTESNIDDIGIMYRWIDDNGEPLSSMLNRFE